MKKIFNILQIITFFILTILIPVKIFAASNNVLNLYSWSGYVPNEIIQQFTKETGIKINISEYDANETMYAKIKASPQTGYDIIIPSNDFVERMGKQNMLTKLDKAKIPSLKNINPGLLNKPFDPGNQYSVPYLWGATGIVVNAKYIDPKTINYWRDLWNPKYKNQLMMLNDLREEFAVGMLVLGYSVDNKNPEHIKQAYLKLKELLPNIKIFNSDLEQTIYIDEDAVIGMGWNGDIHLTQEENPDVKFIYPKDGFVIWIDSMIIPKNAPHTENAYKFINFILRPEIAKQISLTTGYTTPNLAAIKMLPKEVQSNPTINPDEKTLERGQLQRTLGDAAPVYEKYWEMLKIDQ